MSELVILLSIEWIGAKLGEGMGAVDFQPRCYTNCCSVIWPKNDKSFRGQACWVKNDVLQGDANRLLHRPIRNKAGRPNEKDRFRRLDIWMQSWKHWFLLEKSKQQITTKRALFPIFMTHLLYQGILKGEISLYRWPPVQGDKIGQFFQHLGDFL